MTDASPTPTAAVYGRPPAALAPVPAGAAQLSPLIPGAAAVEAAPDGAFAAVTVLAPPATLERRHVLAHALRVLAPGGRLTALAHKDRGGSRLRKELQAFGCEVTDTSRAHHRICVCERPAAPVGLDEALAAGAPRLDPELGLWTQPGVFSWDRIDPGTALLAQRLPPLSGRGADLGSGLGVLARTVLASAAVSELHLVELDRRAVELSRRNVDDPRARFHWADARAVDLPELDFVVANPPFHDGGAEDRSLGAAFIAAAARLLRKGGALWLVANRHLPYEAPLGAAFARVSLLGEAGGYKLHEARK